MKAFLVLLTIVAVVASAAAKVKTETVQYKHGDMVFEGYLSYNTSIKGKRPSILIVHDWFGNSDYTKMRAEQLAALGYLAFAGDVYGKGVRPVTMQEASAEAGKYFQDRQLYRERVRAGLDYLAARQEADTAKLAVMGYCFGGTGALELARSGAPLKAIVTFHGNLSTANPADAKNIRGKVLVLHGADDPFVKQTDVSSFMDEMRGAGVDWQLVQYSGAVHTFTRKSAGNDKSTGSAYNESADRRSWIAMKDFFKEVFGK